MNPQARDRQAKHTAAHPPDRTGREGTLPALNCGRQCLASNGSLKSGVVQASERSAVLRMKQGGLRQRPRDFDPSACNVFCGTGTLEEGDVPRAKSLGGRLGSSVTFEVLNRGFVSFGRFSCAECPEVPAPAGFRVLFPGVQAVLAGRQFSDHFCLHPRPAPRRGRPQGNLMRGLDPPFRCLHLALRTLLPRGAHRTCPLEPVATVPRRRCILR